MKKNDIIKLGMLFWILSGSGCDTTTTPKDTTVQTDKKDRSTKEPNKSPKIGSDKDTTPTSSDTSKPVETTADETTTPPVKPLGTQPPPVHPPGTQPPPGPKPQVPPQKLYKVPVLRRNQIIDTQRIKSLIQQYTTKMRTIVDRNGVVAKPNSGLNHRLVNKYKQFVYLRVIKHFRSKAVAQAFSNTEQVRMSIDQGEADKFWQQEGIDLSQQGRKVLALIQKVRVVKDVDMPLGNGVDEIATIFGNEKFTGGALGNGWVQEEQIVMATILIWAAVIKDIMGRDLMMQRAEVISLTGVPVFAKVDSKNKTKWAYNQDEVVARKIRDQVITPFKASELKFCNMVSWDSPNFMTTSGATYTPEQEKQIRTKQLLALIVAKDKTLFTGNHGGGAFKGNLVKYYLYMLNCYIGCNMANSPVSICVYPWDDNGFKYYQQALKIMTKALKKASAKNIKSISCAGLEKFCNEVAKDENISLLSR